MIEAGAAASAACLSQPCVLPHIESKIFDCRENIKYKGIYDYNHSMLGQVVEYYGEWLLLLIEQLVCMKVILSSSIIDAFFQYVWSGRIAPRYKAINIFQM